MSVDGIDTASPAWVMACLARHICRMPTRLQRLAFMELMRKKKSAEFMADIEKQVRSEWALMYPPKTP